ncbi:MAG TPA: HAMP domain-containing sensor histidine kinase, partial [Anaerolineales bacterium]|nr:HAMP domain-containing sensor histidine kinase [Anaerolineales bacterium]
HMSRRRRLYLVLLSLPVWVGLLSAFLANWLLRPNLSFLYPTEFGIAAFVFGGVIREPRIVAFVTGFLITSFLVLLYFWDQRSARQTQILLTEAQREAERSRRSFLRRLDHEIKNPLTGLRAALVNLQETQVTDERQHAAETAGRAVERLTRLLTDLRKLSDLGERPIELSIVDIPDLLQDAVDAAQVLPAYDRREISLLIPKVPSPFPFVTGDRDLLVLAVYNLIENALKFTSTEDSVEVRAAEDGRNILIEVADSGVGVPPEDAPKIFEELFRASNARGTEGSGLGLALVHRIVSLHDGKISVRSSQENPRGTVFTVRLPVMKRSKVAAQNNSNVQ